MAQMYKECFRVSKPGEGKITKSPWGKEGVLGQGQEEKKSKINAGTNLTLYTGRKLQVLEKVKKN